MTTNKVEVMNYILTGAKAARLLDSKDEEEARKLLTQLSSILDPTTDVPYLLMRIRDRS